MVNKLKILFISIGRFLRVRRFPLPQECILLPSRFKAARLPSNDLFLFHPCLQIRQNISGVRHLHSSPVLQLPSQSQV